MKSQNVKLLDLVIQKSLRSNSIKPINEQVIPTPDEMKYTWEDNIKTAEDSKAFRTWIRITYPEQATKLGLLSQEKVNKLDATEQNKQRALLKTAWKTYGKTYLKDQGTIDVETNDPFYVKPWFIISAVLAFSAIALFAKYKLLSKIFGSEGVFASRAAKKYRTAIALGRTDLSPKQVEELVDMILNLKRGARKDYLQRILQKQMAAEEAAACAEAIEKSPAIQNQIHVTLVGEAAENFINGKGMTEAGLKKAMGPKNWQEKGPALKKARAKITGETPKTPKTTTAVTLKTMGKLKGTKGSSWTNLIKSSASADDIRAAVKQAVKGEDISMKASITIANTVSEKLAKKIGNKSGGAWMLNKHMNAKTFPGFVQWVSDLKSAGITRTLTEQDYFISKSIWNLSK